MFAKLFYLLGIHKFCEHYLVCTFLKILQKMTLLLHFFDFWAENLGIQKTFCNFALEHLVIFI